TDESEREYWQARMLEGYYQEHAVSPAEKARLIYSANVTGQTLQDEAFAKLAAEIADWAEPFEAGLKAKVELAQRTYDDTLSTVRTQLADFDEETVMNDARVKRANSALSSAESLQERFRDSEGLKAWQAGISCLTE